MRTYRYLKNAERWVTVIGLFCLGTTFASQTLWLTKVSIAACGLMVLVRLLLKWKMRSLFRKSSPKQAKGLDDNDYEYVFRWVVVSWTLFVFTIMALGFLISLDWIDLMTFRRTIWGLSAFLGVYTLIVSIRYYQDTKKEKLSGRQEVTAADLNKRADSPAPSNKKKGR